MLLGFKSLRGQAEPGVGASARGRLEEYDSGPVARMCFVVQVGYISGVGTVVIPL